MPTFTAATVDALEAAAGSLPGGSTPPTAGLGRGEPRATDWCFTWNNYWPAEATVLATRCLTGFDDLQYIVWGHETSTVGTPHMQGFVQFKRRVSRSTAQRLLCGVVERARGIHMQPRRGTVEQAVAYCKKNKPDSEWEEYGSAVARDRGGGKRNELHDLVERVQRDGPLTMAELLVDFPNVVARYPRFIEMVNATYEPAPPVVAHPLRPWQSQLAIELNRNPDPRKIIFVVDSAGDAGKSWFADYWCEHFSRGLLMHPAKHADMALVLKRTNPKPRVVFVDCPREKLDYFSYTFLEDLKNGRVFSTKYESRMVRFAPPHVIMMMNSDPDMNKLSQDRYHIIRI
jgi:hypothetical protein